MWADIAALAARQHGVVARRQLLALGAGDAQVHGAVRRGRLERDGRGIYRIAGAPQTPLGEVMSAVLRAGDGARAAGERLLAATGVRDAHADGLFCVLVPAGRRLTGVDFSWRVDKHSSCGTRATARGVSSWAVARNLLEAAVDANHDEDVRTLADGVRRLGRQRGAAASRLALEHPRHSGARRLVALGALDADAAESEPERVLEHLLWDFRLRRQVTLTRGIRVDFLLVDLRVVVEYDGYADHASVEARRRGEHRDDRLRALGYGVVHLTAADLRDPASVLERIHAAAP